MGHGLVDGECTSLGAWAPALDRGPLVGDGFRHEELVGGKVVRSAVGPAVKNDEGQEVMDWASWDVEELKGKQATLQIVDDHSGGWGHVNIDQIVQSDTPKKPSSPDFARLTDPKLRNVSLVPKFTFSETLDQQEKELADNPLLARQDPHEYIEGFAISVRDAIKHARKRPEFHADRILGVGIDTTGSTPLPVDREGVPLAFHEEFADNPAAHAWLWKDHTGVAEAEERLARLGQHSERMAWVLANFITVDTELLAARAAEQFTAAQVEIAGAAARFNDVAGLDYDTKRKLNMLRSGIVIPAPMDSAKTAEQAEIGAKLGGMYGRGEYCPADGQCQSLGDLEDIIDKSRDADELLEAWNGWRTIAPPMKDLYARQVELANEGAAELGFDNLGTMWRSGYDMTPEEFAEFAADASCDASPSVSTFGDVVRYELLCRRHYNLGELGV